MKRTIRRSLGLSFLPAFVTMETRLYFFARHFLP
jgi:hypothetical protein